MSTSANEAALARYFETVNAEDWVGFAEVWQPDATLKAVGGRPRHGLDDILGFYRNLFVAWQRHLDVPTRTLWSGDSATVEVRFDGTTHDGRVVSFDAVDVIDFSGGRIARLTNWYDIAYVRKALAPGGGRS
jgi:ketosteroid isomerase-like protein